MSPKSALCQIKAESRLTEDTLEPVVVDVEVCRKLAGLLASQTIPLDREDSSLPAFSPIEIGNFYLLLVAMCHQTSPRGKPPLEGHVAGRHLRGWDFLSAKLEGAAQVNRELLSPHLWARITADDVRKLFRSDTMGDLLTDPAGRALLARDLGQKMLRRSWNEADQLYYAARGRIANGDPNLLDLLADFRAYDDPVRKKSFFFLALMRNADLWTYADPAELGAPVDYHEVRGHLRLGTVRVCDPDLRTKLLTGRYVTPEQDICIRHAVLKALMLVADFSGIRNPSQLHYLFWNVFRSCCTREDPHCKSCPGTCSLPVRYVPLASFPSGPRRCPFSEICESAGREPKLMEHSIDTDYY
jgi:hypothetical protein